LPSIYSPLTDYSAPALLPSIKSRSKTQLLSSMEIK